MNTITPRSGPRLVLFIKSHDAVPEPVERRRGPVYFLKAHIAGDGQLGGYAHKGGYALINGHWHKLDKDKPAPKSAPKASHPEAAGSHIPAKHLTDDEWAQLKLPESNVNAPTYNSQLDKLKQMAEAGNVTGIVGSSYGVNTYGKKLAVVANHLLGKYGSPHKVAPGQKAGEHPAVQGSVDAVVEHKDAVIKEAIEHLKEDAKQSGMPAGEAAEDKALVQKLESAHAVKVTPSPAADDVAWMTNGAGIVTHNGNLYLFNKEEIKDYVATGPSVFSKIPPAYLEKMKVDASALGPNGFNPAATKKQDLHLISSPEDLGDYTNYGFNSLNADLRRFTTPSSTLFQKLEAAFKSEKISAAPEVWRGIDTKVDVKPGQVLLEPAFMSTSLNKTKAEKFGKGGTVFRIKNAEGLYIGGDESELLINRGAKLRVISSEDHKDYRLVTVDIDIPSASPNSMLSQIPWDKMVLPATNSNAGTHNKKVAQIKALAEAGDVAGLEAMKFGSNNYAKKQALLAQTAIAALKDPASPVAAPVPAPAAAKSPAKSEPLAGTKKKASAVSPTPAATKMTQAAPPAPAAQAKAAPTQQLSSEQLIKLVGSHGYGAVPAPNNTAYFATGKKGSMLATNFADKDAAQLIVAKLKEKGLDAEPVRSSFSSKFKVKIKGPLSAAAPAAGGKATKPANGKAASAPNGPQDGDTKPAADGGMLVFKGGYWHKQSAPAATAADSSAPTPMDSWTQTGPQGGSNPGGKFRDPSGQEWYCKFPADEDHAKSEVLAANLYALAGVAGQDAKLITRNGKIGIASRWMGGTKESAGKLAKADGVHSGFAVDAWLSNWDVIGETNDNLLLDQNGKAVRIDAGGSLGYRAMGAKKAFTNKVADIKNMLDPSVNPSASAVFGSMTQADITASVAKVAAISDAAIFDVVNEHGGGSLEDKKKLAATLIARKKSLIKQFPDAAIIKKAPSFIPAKISAPPNFMSWGNTGAPGPSSNLAVNKGNDIAVQAIYQEAKKGSIPALEQLEVPVYDKSTGQMTGLVSALSHPSQHVRGYAQQALNEVMYQVSPPKVFHFNGGHPIEALHSAYPSINAQAKATTPKVAKFLLIGDAGAVKVEDLGLPPLVGFHRYGGELKEATFAAQARAAFSQMPQKQVDAVKAYTDMAYKKINNSIWSGKPTSDALLVNTALNKYSHDLPPGTVLSRRIHVDNDAELQALVGSVGKVLQEGRIISTSIDPDVFDGNVHLKLIVGPGVKGLYVGKGSAPNGEAISENASEKEIILPPNTRLLVTKVTRGATIKDKHGFGFDGYPLNLVEAVILPNT